jgi:type II secretory pathway component PulK
MSKPLPTGVALDPRRASAPARAESVKRCRGMALLVVMVLTMLLALAAYRFTFYMESQYRVTRVYEEQVHARLAALSGIELAASLVEQSMAERLAIGGMHSNPSLLQNIAAESPNSSSALDTEPNTWRFSLVSPTLDEASPRLIGSNTSDAPVTIHWRFGLENESAKLHIPTLLEWDRRNSGQARAALLLLPGAEESVVDAWLRALGTSSSSQIANGNSTAASSLADRLTDAQDATGRDSDLDRFRLLWCGGDFNQNYQLEPLELQLQDQLLSAAAVSGRSTRSPTAATLDSSSMTPVAWQRFLTWHSGERNESQAGEPRVYLNEPDLRHLHRQLLSIWPAEWANFVIAYRQYGPSASTSTASSNGQVAAGQWSPDFGVPGSHAFTSVLDLLSGSPQVSATSVLDSSQASSSPVGASPSRSAEEADPGSANKKMTLVNPFLGDSTAARNYVGTLLDEATIDPAAFREGRIDLSEAPMEVLAAVPSIDLALARRIVEQRAAGSSPLPAGRATVAWLLEEGIVDLAKLTEIEPYLTCHNDVVSAQVIGYRDSISPIYRCTVVIDGRQKPAQIRSHQVWHPWDRGFSIELLKANQ